MKTIIRLLIFVCFVQSVQAQTYTLNWASSFSPAWVTGNTSGNANNIGGSIVNCNVGLTKSGGIYTTTYGSSGGPATPTVASSPYIVGGSSANLVIALDYATNTEYTDITFTFNKPVFNVSFNIADIDKLTSTAINYIDRITITGYNGVLSGSPSITKYDAVTDPSFFLISGNVAYANPVSGLSGNTNSDATDQKGTIKVKFGGVFITKFVIRYDNYPGTQADPTVQNIAIGNVSFQKSVPLPVNLLSFDGALTNTGVQLNWVSEHETSFGYYSIERSEDGLQFSEIGHINAKSGTTSSAYVFNDIHINSSKYYYRLKMVDMDGSSLYSKTIGINTDQIKGFRAFPTVFTNNVSVSINSALAQSLTLSLTSLSGQLLYEEKYAVKKGPNELQLNFDKHFPPGSYLLSVKELGKTIKLIKR
jgi:hypothetical protein